MSYKLNAPSFPLMIDTQFDLLLFKNLIFVLGLLRLIKMNFI